MFTEKQNGSVVYLTSSLLACPHGFSTRAGGVSAAPHLASMNFAPREDDPDSVTENYRRFTAAVSLPGAVAAASQVHGSDVLTVRRDDLPALALSPVLRPLPEADGFVTAEKGVTLCVKIADCVPLLLWDGEAGVVCALHAGWRGSAAGIALRGVEAMTAHGARPARTVCARGSLDPPLLLRGGRGLRPGFPPPSGRPRRRPLPLGAVYRPSVAASSAGERRVFADLQGLNRYLLLEAGLRPEHIDVSPECTCCDPARFFSHRRQAVAGASWRR